MTWTEVPAPEGRRCWVGVWSDEGCVVLEHEPEWCKPWAVTTTGDGRQSTGTTPREALDGIGCDRPAPDVDAEPDTVPEDDPATGPDTNPRTSAGDAEGSERDDRPVMAWWRTEFGCAYRDPVTGRQEYVGEEHEPHPTALAKVMGWRAVEVCNG